MLIITVNFTLLSISVKKAEAECFLFQHKKIKSKIQSKVILASTVYKYGE